MIIKITINYIFIQLHLDNLEFFLKKGVRNFHFER
jgi:hypothetical protein